MTLKSILFSFSGRLNRKRFWLAFSSVLLAFLGAFFVFDGVLHAVGFNDRDGSGETWLPDLVIALALLNLVLFVWTTLALQVKRLHDCGWSGWWALVSLIPYIGFVFPLIIGVWPGNRGDNRFGPGPLSQATFPISTNDPAAEHWGERMLASTEPRSPPTTLAQRLAKRASAGVNELAKSIGIGVLFWGTVVLIACLVTPGGYHGLAAKLQRAWNDAEQKAKQEIAARKDALRPNISAQANSLPPRPGDPTHATPASPQADPDVLSKPLLEKLARSAIDSGTQQWCLNPVKLKYASNNQIIGLGGDGASDPAGDDNSSADRTPSAANPFPLIFAEEAYLPWSSHDGFIMALLIGGKFIAVHSGGYPQSLRDPGTPGDIYAPRSIEDVRTIVQMIAERGAVIDLTEKGRRAGAWDAANGFCVSGRWVLLDGIKSWTPPAADARGLTVSHMHATISFVPMRLGHAAGSLDEIDPFEIVSRDERTFTATKFNDGWRLAADSVRASSPSGAAQVTSGSGADGGLGGALLTHEILSGGEHDEGGEESSDSDSGDSAGDNDPD